MHWVRKRMTEEAQKAFNKLPTSNMRALEIGGSTWRTNYKWADYANPPFPNFDICLNVLPEQFDVILMDQVLEHVTEPDEALKNCNRMLKDGGYLWISVPFMYPYHPGPLDCWRFSKTGLRILLTKAGFKCEESSIDAWGNSRCLAATAIGGYDPEYQHGMDLTNDEKVPMVVWALVRKNNESAAQSVDPKVVDIYRIGVRNALRALLVSIRHAIAKQ